MNGSDDRCADEIRVHPLHGSVSRGFALDHPYLEVVYAPLIGPSAVLLARTLGRVVTAARAPVTVDLQDVARQLGLRARQAEQLGRRSPILHTLDRLVRTHLARWLGTSDLGIETVIRPLGADSLRRIPETTKAAHLRFVADLDEV